MFIKKLKNSTSLWDMKIYGILPIIYLTETLERSANDGDVDIDKFHLLSSEILDIARELERRVGLFDISIEIKDDESVDNG